MKKMKRIISSILLLCMIVSFMPLVQPVSAATPATYKLDTNGLDLGKSYLIVAAKAVALNGAGTAGSSKAITVVGDEVVSFDGIDDCLWLFDAATSSLKHGDNYLQLTAPSTATAVSYGKDPFPLQVMNTKNYAKESDGRYILYYQDTTQNKYGYLAGSTSYKPHFCSLSTTSFTWTYGMYFYEKIGGEEIKPTASVHTSLDGVYMDIGQIRTGATGLQLRLDEDDSVVADLTQGEAGVYTAEVPKQGKYSLLIHMGGDVYEDTGKDIEIDGADATQMLSYYSVNYNANGGEMNGLAETIVYLAGSEVYTPVQVPIRANYKFTGWQDNQNNIYGINEKITSSLASQIRLSALWEEVTVEKTNYVIRYLVKGTYEKLEDEVTVEGAGVGTEVIAEQQAHAIKGYTYVGATINGVYHDKSTNPKLVLTNDVAKNVIIIHYLPDPDLHLHKEATLEDNGTYTIQLEMFTHNNPITTLVEQNTPLDIVLVLDQSSSMYKGGVADDLKAAVDSFIDLVADHGRTNETDHRIAVVGYGSGDNSIYNGDGYIAGSYSSYKQQTVYTTIGTFVNTGVFDSNGDFHAYPIKGFNYTAYTGLVDPKTGVYYTYSHGEYLLLTHHDVYRHMITETEAYAQWLNGTEIYGYVDGEFLLLDRDNSGLWLYNDKTQLYSSTEFFTWHEDVWTHRHGMEGREIHAYGTKENYAPADGHDNVYTRTEVADGDYDKSIYRDALIPVTMGANGSGRVDDSLEKIVNKLGANGQTYVSYGMEMAYNILDANPLTEQDKEDGRQRIVIVFTDGKPGDSSSFNEAETNLALDMAYDIKDPQNGQGALIYTVGLYGENVANDDADIKRTEKDQYDFLQGLSSNYVKADELEDVWQDVDYIEASSGFTLDQGGYYYVEVNGKHYPLYKSTKQDYIGKDTTQNIYIYRLYWCYKNDAGQEVTALTYLTNAVPVIGENGVITGENASVTVYRKSGVGYQTPDDEHFYLNAESEAKLEEQFATILRELTTKVSTEVDMKNDAILRDIMGQGLVLTDKTVISVYKQDGVFNPDAKAVTWEDEKDMELLDTLQIQPAENGMLFSGKGIEVEGYDEPIPYISVYNLNSANPTDPNSTTEDYHPHTVDIVGYDYGSWYLNADKRQGSKLVVKITCVEAKDDVTWGRAHATNHNQSGLWLRADESGYRELLEAFEQPDTVFVERAYVLDYGKEFELSGWYFDATDENAAAIHVDCEIDNGMNWFKESAPTIKNNGGYGNTNYGNVYIADGTVYYQPTTTQWGGYDQFYVFGKTQDGVITALDANRFGNLWNKVTVIPANNIYYEDSFETKVLGDGANDISGFVFSGDWDIVFTDDKEENAGKNQEDPEQMEDSAHKGTHGWTDDLADDKAYTDGSAHKAGVNETTGAMAVFTFTGTGVDVYTRTNSNSGLIIAMLTGTNLNGESISKSFLMDNLAVSGDYYQIPTVSFDNLDYGTYTVTLIATAASGSITGNMRYEYYLDGIRVYNPLGDVSSSSSQTVKDAYGKELNSVYTEIRDIILTAGDFASDLDKEKIDATGAVFIDWIGTEAPDPDTNVGKPIYEVGEALETYGPKNELYLSQGHAIVIKVDPKNTYYVGMKSLTPNAPVTVNISGLGKRAPQVITVNHATDLYYEVLPIVGDKDNECYIIIQNGSENGGLLALTKLRTTNMTEKPADNGVLAIVADDAIEAATVMTMRLLSGSAEPEPEQTPELSVAEKIFAEQKKLTAQLFTAVRTWLQG